MKQPKPNGLTKLALIVLIGLTVYCPMLIAEDVTIAWDTWELYQYMGPDNQLSGLDIDLTNAIMKNAGLGVVWEKKPWKRVLHEVEIGQLDIGTAASRTKEREKFAYFSIPYRKESVVLYVKKETSSTYKFDSLDKITGSTFKLGVVRGFYYGELYEKLIKNEAFKNHVNIVTKDISNLKKIGASRINGFLMDHVAGTALIAKENMTDQVEIHPMEVYSDDLHYLFSKKAVSSSVVEAVNESIKKLKADGTHQKIMDRYINNGSDSF